MSKKVKKPAKPIKKASKPRSKPTKYELARGFLTENQMIFLTEKYALMGNRAKSIRKRIASKLRACTAAISLIQASTHNFGNIAKAIKKLQSDLFASAIVKRRKREPGAKKKKEP